MTLRIGRTRNFNDVADVKQPITVTSSAAVTIAAANDKRIYFSASAFSDSQDVRKLFLRFYPAAQDNDNRGEILGWDQGGNDVFFTLRYSMPVDNIYTGEISAILAPGQPDIDLYVVEY